MEDDASGVGKWLLLQIFLTTQNRGRRHRLEGELKETYGNQILTYHVVAQDPRQPQGCLGKIKLASFSRATYLFWGLVATKYESKFWNGSYFRTRLSSKKES